MRIADISFEPRFNGLIVTLFIVTILAFTSALLRVATRLWWVKHPGTDDAFIAIAALSTVAFLTASMQMLKYSLKVEYEPGMILNFHQALYSTILAYTATHFSVKFSILFQSRRIFIEPRAQRLFLGLIIYLCTYGIVCVIFTIVTCWPVKKYWDASIPGRCVDRMALQYAFAGINILNDFAILTSPIPFIKSLHVARKTKVALISLFACGGFACIFAIVRVHSLYDKGTAPVSEQPFKGSIICVWSGLEINISIICASVPALRQFFLETAPRLTSSVFGSATRNRGRSMNGVIRVGDCVDQADEILSKSGDDVESRAGRIGIELQPSFEMKAANSSETDDNSERNLVTDGGIERRVHRSGEINNPMAK